MTLQLLRELQRTGGLATRLRAARLLLYRGELAALLELELVKGPLREARGPTALSFLTRRHFLSRNLSLRQRLACAAYHYRFEQATFADTYVASVYRGAGLQLWRHAAEEHRFEIRLTVGHDNLWEGFLSAVAFIDGQRVCVMSFSYVDAALFGLPAAPTLFVTRKQSGRHPEHLHHFARAFQHSSPPYFCLAAVAGIARALAAKQIALIRHQAHPSYAREQAEVLRKTYDEFWTNLGARELDDKAYGVAVPLEAGDAKEVSASHRARARKRREARLAVEESACAATASCLR